ncbi:DUF84 family protein [Vibrio parahaemolyticus]|nr:DUF84 family protein [Vibrio parahaemolyticus]EJC7073054.1 DUF84 family protein [Vibrio parahaemolyticus]EKN4536722.1 DUF84 family protein [Vibrio parahaemolyticus]
MATQKVVIASLNPAKINAVKSAFQSAFPQQAFEFVGISVPSEVADQPMTNEDTHRGESRSASLMLPPEVLAQLADANELGDVMDKVFGTENIKQKGGAISLLTQNQLTRSSVYHQALILALIPFTNPDHFPANL